MLNENGNNSTDPIDQFIGENGVTDPPKRKLRGPDKKPRKKRKGSKSSRSKRANNSTNTNTTSSQNTGSNGSKSSWDNIFEKYNDDLDGDTKKKREEEDDDDDDQGTGSKRILEPDQDPEIKRPRGKSLIMLTNVIFPMVDGIVLTILTKGKQKIPISRFRMDDIEKEILSEIADEAGDAILGKVSDSAIYIILVTLMNTQKIIAAYQATKLD